MLTDDTRKEAVEACRQWSRIRDWTLSSVADAVPARSAEVLESLQAFDEQMFRLGGEVFQAEGEVVVRSDRSDP